MDEILEIIEKARNLPMDHEPDASDLWDLLNSIEKIAQDELNNPVPPWLRQEGV
mgnify:CR=1 FL=1